MRIIIELFPSIYNYLKFVNNFLADKVLSDLIPIYVSIIILQSFYFLYLGSLLTNLNSIQEEIM